ncbi:NAD(P)-binding protein [Rhizopogon vinicolor AM-OR11-026]|uniref:NAD(P)-binding protein n=1 Tax=Rhizopogon vinicolor AM-OR11-026 TaxID=1314800 RepID=A0A1B7NE67_9AGAM|nr:NAD(P)-binding protein [Rhizopogon vinicolor AM-OR11-026]
MGNLVSWLGDAAPPKSTFSVDQIPDLTGKVVIVTGANTGIGKETAKALLAHGAKVYIAARNQASSEETVRQLKQETGNEAFFFKLDLGDLKAIKSSAEEFLGKETQLHILINNAGVMVPPVELVTSDGYDLQFGTNVLGHYYFTKLLLPVLTSTAKATPEGKVRVVNVASCAHLFGKLDFNTFKDGPARKKCTTGALYNQSKFGNIILALELAKRYGDQGIISTALNPGNIRSDLLRHVPSIVQQILSVVVLYPTPQGALTQLYAATSPEAASLNGKYLVPWARVKSPRQETQDPQLGKALWDWLEEQVKDV